MQVPDPDVEVLSSGVISLGGQWRMGLTKDVTHLFATLKGSSKYITAMEYQEHTHIKVLLPHWCDHSIELGIRLPTAPYEWPDPTYLKEEKGDPKLKSLRVVSPEKKLLYKTATWEASQTPSALAVKNVWEGQRILLSPSLELLGGRRRTVELMISRAQGVAIKYSDQRDEEEESRKVEECDVLVTRYRSGKAYHKVRYPALFVCLNR